MPLKWQLESMRLYMGMSVTNGSLIKWALLIERGKGSYSVSCPFFISTNLLRHQIMDIDYTVGEVELTYKSTSKSRNKIYSSEDAYEVLLSTYKKGTICYKEYFKVLFLNQAKQVLGYTLISEGGITETCADIRVILQAALLTNSVAIILAHNHPSGNLKPSRQDMEITKQVKEAARLMRITVLDHLILTDAGYYSFADEGEL